MFDRTPGFPIPDEEQEAVVAFCMDFIDQAEADGVLHDMIKNWSTERIALYERSFFLYGMSQQMLGLVRKDLEKDDDSPGHTDYTI